MGTGPKMCYAVDRPCSRPCPRLELNDPDFCGYLFRSRRAASVHAKYVVVSYPVRGPFRDSSRAGFESFILGRQRTSQTGRTTARYRTVADRARYSVGLYGGLVDSLAPESPAVRCAVDLRQSRDA